MEEITFHVQGTAAEPYKTTFVKRGLTLATQCTCPAGKRGRCCKHRLRILRGCREGIVSDNRDQVDVVQSWLGSGVYEALKERDQAEQALDVAKERLAAAKRRLESMIELTR